MGKVKCKAAAALQALPVSHSPLQQAASGGNAGWHSLPPQILLPQQCPSHISPLPHTAGCFLLQFSQLTGKWEMLFRWEFSPWESLPVVEQQCSVQLPASVAVTSKAYVLPVPLAEFAVAALSKGFAKSRLPLTEGIPSVNMHKGKSYVSAVTATVIEDDLPASPRGFRSHAATCGLSQSVNRGIQRDLGQFAWQMCIKCECHTLSWVIASMINENGRLVFSR